MDPKNMSNEEIMGRVRSEMAVNSAQELISRMTHSCFKMCVPSPSAKLGSSEQVCVAKCMDRFMESWNLVAQSYAGHIQRRQGASKQE